MPESVAIILPCYNEEAVILRFLGLLESKIGQLGVRFQLVVVNDSSNDQTLDLLKTWQPQSKNIGITILDLFFNQGHQGAIYQGLVYAESLNADHLIVMDSDGEDDPEAIGELLKYRHFDVVKVYRGKRNENLRFRIGYQLYKSVFRLITRAEMNYGNFVMISPRILKSAVHFSFIHFAAFLTKQRCTQTGFVWDKSERLGGESKMNLPSLIDHGIKSFIELSKELLFFIFRLFIFFTAVLLIGIFIVLKKKYISGEAIIGWTSTLLMLIFIAGLICLGVFIIGNLLVNILEKYKQSNRVVLYRVVKEVFPA
jgi:glycosyltransferase involved in cell wall biosynthesis